MILIYNVFYGYLFDLYNFFFKYFCLIFLFLNKKKVDEKLVNVNSNIRIVSLVILEIFLGNGVF